jgi:hypothetical protein
MSRKERRRRRQLLIFRWRTDPQGVAERAFEAVLNPNPQNARFLADLGEALAWIRPDGSLKPDVPQFHEQVESALGKLLLEHGPKGVKAPMIYKAVNPRCSPQQYSEAFRRIGVRFTKSGIVFVRAQIALRRAEIVKEKKP